MLRTLTVIVALTALTAVTNIGPHAFAGPDNSDDVEYRELMEDARQLYVDEMWSDARDQYLAAYELHQAPQILYLVATTLQRQGYFRQAQMYFREYLAKAPESDSFRQEALAFDAMLVKLIGTRDYEPAEGVGSGELVVGAIEDEAWHRPGARYRKAFWATLGGVGVGVLATSLSVSHVRSLEDDKLELAHEFLQEAGDTSSDDVCAAAEGSTSATAREIVSVCDSGRRWATISNGLMLGTALSAVAAGYLYYKGFIEPPTSPERFRITPAIGTSSVSMGIALDF